MPPVLTSGLARVQLQGPLFNGVIAAKLTEVLTKAMRLSLARVEAATIKETPVNLGHLRASYGTAFELKFRSASPFPSALIGVVGSPLAYAPFVEFGTGPLGEFHQVRRWPPKDPIEAWVRRKMFTSRTRKRPAKGTKAEEDQEAEIARITFLVRRKIGVRGTVGIYMLRRAIRNETPWVQRAFAAAMKSLEKQT